MKKRTRIVNGKGNPLLRLYLQRWRMRLVMTFIFGGFVALTLRATYLQAWQTDFLTDQGEKRINRVVTIPAHRGMILDRRGETLAVSTPVESLWLNPHEAHATHAQIKALAKRLQMTSSELDKRFAEKDKRFVFIKRLLAPDVAKACLDLDIKGLHDKPEFRRYYPAGEVMAQVLGITNVSDKGIEGLELAYNTWLSGEPGLKRVVVDRKGNIIEDLDLLRLPKPGNNLTLSIDLQIQYLAYRELLRAVIQHKAKAGSIVVLNAKTGEILALANVPSYNPNNRATMTLNRARDRAVTDAYEPGSTMKPFLVSTALEDGVVTPNTRIDTGPGYYYIGDNRISDVHPSGIISVAQTIQVSSNVAAARIALDTRSEDYWRMLTHAGFGAPPKSGLPGETAGIVRPYQEWRPIEKATMAFGMGISVSLLQLARAYTVFANDGVLMPLTVLKRHDAVIGQRIMSAKTAREMRAMLELVTQDGGTAPRARVMGYQVAGKTGTAHKLIKGKYSPTKYIASFVGMAPASNPRLIVAVMVDEPKGWNYYGGLVAGPVFSKVMGGALRLLAIPPDAPMDKESAPNKTAPVVGESA